MSYVLMPNHRQPQLSKTQRKSCFVYVWEIDYFCELNDAVVLLSPILPRGFAQTGGLNRLNFSSAWLSYIITASLLSKLSKDSSPSITNKNIL